MRFLQPAGFDLFCLNKKFLVYNLVSRNLKIKYRRSFLGFFWTILSPLATAIIFYLVFKKILKVQIPHYMAFILSGVLPWAFFSQTVNEGLESLVGNVGLLGKVPIPIQVFPWTGTLTNASTLILAFPIIIAAAYFTDVNLSWSILALTYFGAMLIFFTYGLSLILSVAYVYFRDLKHLMSLILQLWFYGTPVVYNESMIPDQWKWALYLNPIGPVFSAFHTILTEGQWPSISLWLICGCWTLGTLAIAVWVNTNIVHDLVEQL